MASGNESESDGSVPELEESEPLRPSEPQVSLIMLLVGNMSQTDYLKSYFTYDDL